MRVLATFDYVALTPPRKTIPWDQANDLARRGLVFIEGEEFKLTHYGELAVRVYEAWRQSTATVAT